LAWVRGQPIIGTFDADAPKNDSQHRRGRGYELPDDRHDREQGRNDAHDQGELAGAVARGRRWHGAKVPTDTSGSRTEPYVVGRASERL
jgi:hypothetical protein